jgi:flagellar biosynthesis/type III secretory pathway protein FliH
MNKQQTAVEWLLNAIETKNGEEFSSYYSEFIEQAKEMEIAGKEISYADGYAEGYKRAIELTKWAISNLIPPHNEQNNQSNQEHI